LGIVKRTHPDVVIWQKLWKKSRRADQRLPVSEQALSDFVAKILARYKPEEYDDFLRHLANKE